MLKPLTLVSFLSAFTLSMVAHGAGRVALVIGNAAYPDAPLRNPVNDARAMSQRLGALGFDVISLQEATKGEMEHAILDFAARLDRDSTGLFYFAGHGIQARGRNYLIPVDAKLETERSLKFEAVEVSDVLEDMEDAGNRVNLVILDACRNNPFERRFRGGSRGLAAIDAARGTLIAYATAPGSVAADGEGENGLYTEELLRALAQPGLKVEDVFKRVRIAVSDRTGGKQLPWESSSLTGDFVFNATAKVESGVSATIGSVEPMAVELSFWESIKESDNPAYFREYLQRYGDGGQFSGLARLRVAELEGGASESSGQAGGIGQLLALAEADIAALRLTSPKGNNAVEKIREALAIEPQSHAALRLRSAVVQRYLGLAGKALDKGRTDKAKEYLARAEGVEPGSEAIEVAREKIADIETETAEAEALRQAMVEAEERRQAKAKADRRAAEAAQQAAVAEERSLRTERTALKIIPPKVGLTVRFDCTGPYEAQREYWVVSVENDMVRYEGRHAFKSVSGVKPVWALPTTLFSKKDLGDRKGDRRQSIKSGNLQGIANLNSGTSFTGEVIEWVGGTSWVWRYDIVVGERKRINNRVVGSVEVVTIHEVRQQVGGLYSSTTRWDFVPALGHSVGWEYVDPAGIYRCQLVSAS